MEAAPRTQPPAAPPSHKPIAKVGPERFNKHAWQDLLISSGLLAELTGTEAKVLTVLLSHCHHKQKRPYAWPSRERIGRLIGKAKSTVSRAIAGLEAKRVLRRCETPHKPNRVELLPLDAGIFAEGLSEPVGPQGGGFSEMRGGASQNREGGLLRNESQNHTHRTPPLNPSSAHAGERPDPAAPASPPAGVAGGGVEPAAGAAPSRRRRERAGPPRSGTPDGGIADTGRAGPQTPPERRGARAGSDTSEGPDAGEAGHLTQDERFRRLAGVVFALDRIGWRSLAAPVERRVLLCRDPDHTLGCWAEYQRRLRDGPAVRNRAALFDAIFTGTIGDPVAG